MKLDSVEIVFLSVTLVAPSVYGFPPIIMRPSDSLVVTNDCAAADTWVIRVEPDPGLRITSAPYVQGHHGEALCEAFFTADTNFNDVDEYTWLLDITERDCGIKSQGSLGNGSYEVVMVLPSRSDGVETRFDHILFIQCQVPGVHLHRNQTAPGIATDTVYMSLGNATTHMAAHTVGITPPAISILVTRDGVPIANGADAFLGEELNMEVRVIDSTGVYTRVKVQQLWSTYENNPAASVVLDLIKDGCPLDPALMGPFLQDGGATDKIKAIFYVFRFTGQEHVHFWLTITSCPITDDVTCKLECPQARRRRGAGVSPEIRRGSPGPLYGMTRYTLRVTGTQMKLQNFTRDILTTPSPREPEVGVCMGAGGAAGLGVVGMLIVAFFILLVLYILRKKKEMDKKTRMLILNNNNRTPGSDKTGPSHNTSFSELADLSFTPSPTGRLPRVLALHVDT